MRSHPETQQKIVQALQRGDGKTAVSLCKRLLRKQARDPATRKLLVHALMAAGELPEAAVEAERLVRTAPGDGEARLLLGHVLLHSNRAAEACRQLEAALEQDPGNASAWHELALARRLAESGASALPAFARAHRLDPGVASYRDNYALALVEFGDPELALELCATALEATPHDADLLHLAGQAHLALGQFTQARERLQEAHARAPDDASVAATLGACLAALNQPDAALPLLLEAARSGPGRSATRKSLLLALAESGEADEVLRQLERGPEVEPAQRAPAVTRLVESLITRCHFSQADALLRAARARDPEMPVLLGSAAHLEIRLGRTDLAHPLLEKACAGSAGDDKLLRHRALLEAKSGHLDRAIRLHAAQMDALEPTSFPNDELLLDLNYLDHADPDLVFTAHRDWARATMSCLAGEVTAPERRAPQGRRLRVGFVSPDFREHSVAYFIEPFLAAYDRQRFEVFCYYNNLQVDATTQRLRRHVDHWRGVFRLSDTALCDAVREDGIDILVDLAGHTRHNRLGVFARRAAPLQVTWLGYPNTTGLTSIDYRLCDPLTDPEGDGESQHSETLLRLPEGFLCYAGPDTPLPSRHGGDELTFGSFNNLEKVTSTTLGLWSRILTRVPGSRLLLKSRHLADPTMRAVFGERLRGSGIDTDRVELMGRLGDRQAHLDLYGRVDIALDTTPYNGTTTTCEALWMGTPVVTLRGDRHAARVGASLLAHAGLSELVAETAEAYVELAVALAGDPDRRTRYHDGLREMLARSVLCDGARHTRQLEATFLRLWREHGGPAAGETVDACTSAPENG